MAVPPPIGSAPPGQVTLTRLVPLAGSVWV
jgi:hypothetical protein